MQSVAVPAAASASEPRTCSRAEWCGWRGEPAGARSGEVSRAAHL